jgi:thiol-disulfide isomerase/thioredoxin
MKPIVAVVLGLLAAAGAHAEFKDIPLDDKTTLSVVVYPAAGRDLLLWLPSGFAANAAEEPLAEQVAKRGVEVWRADLVSARFLPLLESSLNEIPESDVRTLIEAAQASGKRVHLVASARAAALALRGARAWQLAHPKVPALGGAILLHPNLYAGPPEPGREAEFHPVVAQTVLPIYLIQSGRSPWHFRIETLTAALERAGSVVKLRELPGVRDRYYFRPDASDADLAAARRLPADLVQAVNELRAVKITKPIPPASAAPTVKVGKVRELQPYKGNPTPPPLTLTGLDGKAQTLADYRGQAVLINFWASWCPPCVKEMPSLESLKQKLAGKPFTILGVNMAESEAEVRAFLKEKVNVSFPILLDRDGAALKQWKVFVYPTTYLLAPDGTIRYALLGEAEWDGAHTVQLINELIAAKP